MNNRFLNQPHGLLATLFLVISIGVFAFALSNFQSETHWTQVTVSALCRAELPNGAPNASRHLAITGLLMLCVSMATIFQLISRKVERGKIAKTIQVGGIGSMVYALLTATPMHNLMVSISLAFFLVAVIAIIFWLFQQSQPVLASIGVACVLIKFASMSIYYADLYSDWWGLIQKLSFCLTTSWLVAVLLIRFEPRT